MPSAKVTSKGQITIPVKVRRAMGIKAGTEVMFFETLPKKTRIVNPQPFGSGL